jgi:PAS domain-containing protein
MKKVTPAYQIDAKWRIQRANEAFCQAFRCTEAGLLGRDIRELLREDWRRDFRNYVARALVGVGGYDITLPMVAPSGQSGWYKHSLEPMLEDGVLVGYRATVTPRIIEDVPARRWFDRRLVSPKLVWDFDSQTLANAS